MPKKKLRIEELEKKSVQVGFWDDNQKAAPLMQELEMLRGEFEVLSKLETEIDETIDFLEVFSETEESSEEEEKEIEERLKTMNKKLDELEFKTLFSGEYDNSSAILTIMSGAGGVDAQDWSEMLLRMYLKWAEKKGYRAKMIDETRGSEAGIKSATMEISGAYAYGNLQSESGVHRLVRLSPFNADNLRQTSFASVEVLPVIEEISEVEINPSDLRVDVYRSSGAGGQSVNTTDSAVRITHLPSGLVATCQNERSQFQNKEQAMKILIAKLHKSYLEKQEAEKKKLRGEPASAEWGSQIRSYVLHPYKMVKDHRTKCETAQAESVLEGDLDAFMESYLKYLRK